VISHSALALDLREVAHEAGASASFAVISMEGGLHHLVISK
jgi:hypothetical protein